MKISTSSQNSATDSDLSSNVIGQANALDKEKVSPSSFTVHSLIGKGSFGEVYLVEKKNTKQLFAMKVLEKSKIISNFLSLST